MPDQNPIDFDKCVIIRRHDGSVFAIPLDQLDQYKVDPQNLDFDETALVQTMGCYNCRSICASGRC